MTIADVNTILNHHVGLNITHLAGMLAEKHQEQTLCPNAVIARERESAADNLQVFEYVRPRLEEKFSLYHPQMRSRSWPFCFKRLEFVK